MPEPPVFEMTTFKLVVLLSLGWGLPQGTTIDTVISRGVVFSKIGQVAFASKTHTLGLSLDLDHINAHLIKMAKTAMVTANTVVRFENPLTPYFNKEVARVARTINSTMLDLNDFATTFDPREARRQKRYTNLLGWAASTVLGLATEEELADLASQINENQENTKTMINKIISHVTLTDRQIERLTKATTQVEMAYEALTHHVRKTDKVLANMQTEVVFGQKLNVLVFAALETQAEV